MLVEGESCEMFRGGVVDDSFLLQTLTAFHVRSPARGIRQCK